MKKSTDKVSQRRKLVLQREAIAVLTLTLPQLGDVQSGLTSSFLTIRTCASGGGDCQPE